MSRFLIAGWTVFQKRFDGSVDFYRNWASYKEGFGSVYGEYWLGNDRIHDLTQNGVQLKILLKENTVDGVANYSNFKVEDESINYKMTFSSYNGNAGDALNYHKGQMFSTYDKDNDSHDTANCAERHDGAWWFKSCYYSNLNGLYAPDNNSGVVWNGVSPFSSQVSVDETILMIR